MQRIYKISIQIDQLSETCACLAMNHPPNSSHMINVLPLNETSRITLIQQSYSDVTVS